MELKTPIVFDRDARHRDTEEIQAKGTQLNLLAFPLALT